MQFTYTQIEKKETYTQSNNDIGSLGDGVGAMRGRTTCIRESGTRVISWNLACKINKLHGRKAPSPDYGGTCRSGYKYHYRSVEHFFSQWKDTWTTLARLPSSIRGGTNLLCSRQRWWKNCRRFFFARNLREGGRLIDFLRGEDSLPPPMVFEGIARSFGSSISIF